MATPKKRLGKMCRDHIKAWYEGTGLSPHAVMEKAKSLPGSIRNRGILGTSRIIMRTFFQYTGVVKQ